MAATPNATGRDAAPPAACSQPQWSHLHAGEAEALLSIPQAKPFPGAQQRNSTLFLGTGSLWGNEAALAKDEGTGHPCCQLPSLFPSVVLA